MFLVGLRSITLPKRVHHGCFSGTFMNFFTTSEQTLFFVILVLTEFLIIFFQLAVWGTKLCAIYMVWGMVVLEI